jgi:drug/metabolite transporter (DMT)-like permease
LPLILGLTSALCWGSSDFLGGIQSRRITSVAVVLWSQLIGGIAIFAVLLLTRQDFGLSAFGWGVGAGVFTGSALVLFYRGLATGAMAMVAPISACGVIVPVVAAFAFGDAPTALETLGIAFAILGVVVVSLPGKAAAQFTASHRQVLLLAIGAAIGFGLFYLFVDRGSAAAGSPLWVIGGARAGSFTTVLLIVLATRTNAPIPGRRILPVIVLIGLLDTTANALFAYATTHGNLGVVSVFASLYPVVTVLLAVALTSEVLTRRRSAGAILALAGVVLLSAG